MASASIPSHHTHHTHHTHQRRPSLRLSSDTTSTLPEYNPLLSEDTWHKNITIESSGDENKDDKPPDYSDSAEEADEEDTDLENTYYQHHSLYASRPLTPSFTYRPPSPRRIRKNAPVASQHPHSYANLHRRKKFHASSSPSDHLDSLLERSVHALEMSNTLLQSSMETQSSLSTVMAADYSTVDNTRSLEDKALGLTVRMHNVESARANWTEELSEISRGVEGLINDGGDGGDDDVNSVGVLPQRSEKLKPGGILIGPKLTSSRTISSPERGSCVSQSLPTSSPLSRLQPNSRSIRRRGRGRPSRSPDFRPHQVDFGGLGLRLKIPLATVSATNLPLYNNRDESFCHSDLHGLPSSPRVTPWAVAPSTPAYNMLASLVTRPSRSGSSTPNLNPSPCSSPFPFLQRAFLPIRRRHSLSNSTGTGTGMRQQRLSRSPNIRHPHPHPLISPRMLLHHPSQTTANANAPSPATSLSPVSSSLPKEIMLMLPPERTTSSMTPPTEESSLSSDTEGNDGDGRCPAKRTVMSLRKILDDQEQHQQRAASRLSPSFPSPKSPRYLRPPAFLPRTAARTVAEAGTSTTTASVSRLYTRGGKHTASTRAPSPPRHSALKQPSPSSSTAALSEQTSQETTTSPPAKTLLSGKFGSRSSSSLSIAAVLSGAGFVSGSGRLTPKKISFAELPESYSGTKPGGGASREQKQRRSHRKRSRRRSGSTGRLEGENSRTTNDGVEETEGELGWWSAWFLGSGSSAYRQEVKIEDRMTRSWGGRMGMGGSFDDWAI